MTSNLIPNQIKRDDQLTSVLCVNTGHTRGDLEAWIQEELIESIQVCSIRLEIEVDGPFRGAVENALQRLRRINTYELPEALNRSKKTTEDVGSGEPDNVFEGYDWLVQSLSDLIRIGREVLEIRNQLNDIAE